MESKAYWLMAPIAETNLEHYKNDFFVHDKKALAENPKTDFVWFVRDTGTNLAMLGLKEQEQGSAMAWFDSFCKANKRVFFYSAREETLEEIDKTKASELADKLGILKIYA